MIQRLIWRTQFSFAKLSMDQSNTDAKVYTITDGEPRCPHCEMENEESEFSATPGYTARAGVKTFYKDGEYHEHDNNIKENRWVCSRNHSGIMEKITRCPARKCIEHLGRIRIRTIPKNQITNEHSRDISSEKSLLDQIIIERIRTEILLLREELANEFRREIREQILRELDAMQRLDRK